MPRIAASAAIRRRCGSLSDGRAADRMAKAPVLIMPPKTCAASCNPPADASAGKPPRRCCVAWTDGIVIAVARTNAMVGSNAAKISTLSPARTISATAGTSSRMTSSTHPSSKRMIRLSRRRRGNVRRMKNPSATAPAAVMIPCGWPRMMLANDTTQAKVSKTRRKAPTALRTGKTGILSGMRDTGG